MFANLLQLFTRRTPPDYNLAFVREVRVNAAPEPRSRKLEKLLVICWALIALKCILVRWLIRHYQVPFNPWWINAPTVGAGAICTGVYLRRR